MEKNSDKKSSIWDSSLYRTSLIAITASAILGIGIWIGKVFNDSGLDQVQTDLGVFMTYIGLQNSRLDSLYRIIPNQSIDAKYFDLNDFEEEVDVKCSRGEEWTTINFTTGVFAYLGEGIHEYRIILRKFVDGKYIFVYQSETSYFKCEEPVRVTLQSVYPNIMLNPKEKYQIVLKVGNYKELQAEMICG